jgi:prevent-host-death family protein
MTTRTIELTDATQSLADYAQQVDGGSIVVTSNGKPIAAVVALPNTDAETIALSQSPQFLAIMERSRIRYAQEGGISSADMRKRLGLASTQDDSPAAD